MRTKFGSLADWVTVSGAHSFTVPGSGPRPLRFEGMTEGASVSVSDDSGHTLVFAGVGRFEVDCGIVGEAYISVDGDVVTSIRVDGVKPREIGWTDEPSIADTEPKKFGDVSPEVRRMFDVMQANMLQREAALRAELTRRK